MKSLTQALAPASAHPLEVRMILADAHVAVNTQGIATDANEIERQAACDLRASSRAISPDSARFVRCNDVRTARETAAIIMRRSSILYDPPEGTRRLASSTSNSPRPVRTTSMPAMCT